MTCACCGHDGLRMNVDGDAIFCRFCGDRYTRQPGDGGVRV